MADGFDPPGASVEFDLSPGPVWSWVRLLKPRVQINGGPERRLAWGISEELVPPGDASVEVWVDAYGFSSLGRNRVEFSGGPASRFRVTWRSPNTVFSKGKMTVTELPSYFESRPT